MHKLTAILATLALTASTGIAAPRKHRAHSARPSEAATEAYIVACINERTGPTDGISAREAIKLCTGIAKHQARIDKLAERAAKAIEACEEEVGIACEDTTERDHDGGECSDDTLRAKHAFDVCTGHGPAWAAKEGK